MKDSGTDRAGSPPERPRTWGAALLRWLLVTPAVASGFVIGAVFNAHRFGDGGELGPGVSVVASGVGSVVGVAFGCAAAPRGRAWVGWSAGVLIAGGSVALVVAGGWRNPTTAWALAGAGLGGLVAAIWAWRSGGSIDFR